MRADMLLLERAAARPPESKARQMKPDSNSRGSFQRTLQKELRRDQSTQSPSAANKSGDTSSADAEAKLTTQDTAREKPPTEATDARGSAKSESLPEAASLSSAESAETGLTAELTEGLMATALTQSPQRASFGEESVEPSAGQTRTGWGTLLAYRQPGFSLVQNTAMQTTTPALTDTNSITTGMTDALTGIQPDANQQGQITAGSADPGTGSAESADARIITLLSKAGRIAEGENSEKPQRQTDNQNYQNARELADWESRKLTGQKAQVIQPSAAAEHQQSGKETRSDYTYQAVRPEGPAHRVPELNSLVTDKTASFDSKVDTQEILNQIVRKAELLVKNGQSQMKIELYPEFLGKLTIKVMVEEGAVTAKFITDNHQVKQMLEANLGMLRQSLENQGMRVERAEVDVQLNNGSLFDGSHEQPEWNWDNRQLTSYAKTNLTESSGYQTAQELLPPQAAAYETYGIYPDGSLNFLI